MVSPCRRKGVVNMDGIIVEISNPVKEAGYNAEAVNLWRGNHGAENYPMDEWEDWIDQFDESYVGYYDNTSDFAAQLADETYLSAVSGMPQWVTTYFDYDKFERDLFLGDYWESEGHIFRSI